MLHRRLDGRPSLGTYRAAFQRNPRLYHAPCYQQARNRPRALFVLHNMKAETSLRIENSVARLAKVSISDPARTLVDMIAAPEVGGGIDHVADCLSAYLDNKPADRESVDPLCRAVRQRRHLQTPRISCRNAAARQQTRSRVPVTSDTGLCPARSRASSEENSSLPGGSGCRSARKQSAS